jgi:hypothetical protein
VFHRGIIYVFHFVSFCAFSFSHLSCPPLLTTRSVVVPDMKLQLLVLAAAAALAVVSGGATAQEMSSEVRTTLYWLS